MLADGANSWNDLHDRFAMQRIGRRQAYSDDIDCPITR